MSVDFVGARGYAAGEAGTLLRSDDGGQTWAGLTTYIGPGIDRVDVVDADTIIAHGSYCVLRRSDDGGKTFRSIFYQHDYSCTVQIIGVSFPDKDTGYVLQADGSFFRTADGGQTFTQQTAVPGTEAGANANGTTAADVAFTGRDTGFVFVSKGGAPSTAYRTTDGGISWTPVDHVDSGSVRRVFMLDAQHGFAVGPQTLLATTDGGQTWTSRAGGANRDLAWIHCLDELSCVLTTVKGDVLLRTSDGGETLAEVTPSSQPIYAAAFSSPTRVVAVGAEGEMVASDDGGQNFTSLTQRVGGVFSRLAAGPSPLTAFALGGKGAMAVTDDGGSTWQPLTLPSSSPVADVSFPERETGYALDLTGDVFKTLNGGATWATLDSGGTTSPGALFAPSTGVVELVGPRGIRRSDGGGEFSSVGPTSVAHALLTDVLAHRPVVTAWGPRAVVVSADTGEHWHAVRVPKGIRLEHAEFPSARAGYLLTTKKRMFATTNGGKTWREIFAGFESINGMSMTSATRGYLAMSQWGGNDGSNPDSAYALLTTDGGLSWRPQEIARGVTGAILATTDQHAYALIGPNHLLFTDSAGSDSEPRYGVLGLQSAKVKKGRIEVRGSTKVPEGGAFVVVSRRDLTGTKWTHQVVHPGANGGGFVTSWKTKRSSVFVAQMLGGNFRRADGSAPLIARVGSVKR